MANTKNKDCMAYKNKVAYTMQYNKENTSKRVVMFNKNMETDKAIMEFIESRRPFSSYVKRLILEDMRKEKKAE